MRWKHQGPSWGEHRVIKKFLWFPLRISDETRWLERAYILQEFSLFGKWINSRWDT